MAQKGPTSKPRPRDWAPRIWLGCDLFAWLRLMAKGRFRWGLPQLHIGACTFAASCGHLALRYAQEALYGARIRHTRIKHPPVFIIGHWRTGTTLLHEWLILDPRHNCPNTYQCFEPNHFLLTERLVKRYLGFLMPDRRPMDNMAAGWDRPQEDEFGLCMMGLPSPYLHVAFPNEPPFDQEAFDLEGLPPWQRRKWRRGFYRFLQALTFKDPRRLILKSPPHSCRIPTLLEMFPDARFLHIVRNPYVVYPSTVNLWKSLHAKQGMQTPRRRGVEEYVLRTFTHLYARLEQGRRLIPAGRYHEVRYEDLIANPIDEMRTIYDRLDLGDFKNVEVPLQEWLARNRGYETNKWKLTPEQCALVTEHWADVIRRYQYPIEPATALPRLAAAHAG